MTANEKLPLAQQPPAAPRPNRRSWLSYLTFAIVGLWFLSLFLQDPASRWPEGSSSTVTAKQCAQVEPLVPTLKTSNLDKMVEYLSGSDFRKRTIERMAGAIQIPSESFDDMGDVGEDKRWDIMFTLSDYLEKTFPLTHKSLMLEKVNTHGLLYTWQGSDASLKPYVLMAHQDVVPVAKATVEEWEHPPFSGAYDGKYIWGRGSLDCKNSLVGILEAVEHLLEADFTPKRTVVLSFGFDEEISGQRGAGHLSAALLERYGKNGIASIVDEGAGVYETWGTNIALPGVAEKGYIDVNIVVRMPGGHSSIPPVHTGIGVMSELLSLIEANPYEPRLYPENPYLETMQCGAAHGPDFPTKLKKLLPRPGKTTCSKKKKDKLAEEAAKESPFIKYLFTTSQAIDIIGGGVKANALPERTTALVNHRINVGDHPATVQEKITKLTATIAKKYNLTLNAFNGKPEVPSSITLFASNETLSPAPVTPTSTRSVTPYSVLSGTIRALYGEEMIVAPGLMTGNTDTRYYWDLTEHIFRYGPGWDPEEDMFAGAHTVNEKVSVVNHVRVVQWYSLFVRNMDEAEL